MGKIEKYGSKRLSDLTTELRHCWERYDIYSEGMGHKELAPGSDELFEHAAEFIQLAETYGEWKEAARAEIGAGE